jgi:hypothetical protein
MKAASATTGTFFCSEERAAGTTEKLKLGKRKWDHETKGEKLKR